MRATLLPAVLLLLWTCDLHAQVPNGSFEAWFTVPNTPLLFPEQWTLSIGQPTQNVTQTATARTGNLAVRGEVVGTSLPPPFNVQIPRLESIATFGPGSTVPPEPGFLVSNAEPAVSGFYILDAVGGDELLVIVQMLRFTSTDSALVGLGSLSLPAASSYTAFTAPINYSSGDPPTHCWIIITVQGVGTTPQPGSVFLVDDISFSGSTTVDEGEWVTAVTALENYPNPFSERTKLSFSLNKPTFVSVAIFDLLGRQVEELVAGYLPQGGHHVSFDASTLPSGVYLYRIEGDGSAKTRPMIVSR